MTREPFPGLRPPQPARELRARVLARARHAARRKPERLADRLWRSRPLRAAWLVSVLVLLALNFAQAPAERGAPDRSPAATTPAWLEEIGSAELRYVPEHTLKTYHEPAKIEALGV